MLNSRKTPILNARRSYVRNPRKSGEGPSTDLRVSYASRKFLETIRPAVLVTRNK